MNEPNPSLLSTPKRRPASTVVTWSSLSSILLIVAIVLGNAALASTNRRIDLTEERLWTLSPATKRVLSRLTEPATVKVYWSDEIPKTAESLHQQVEGLLEEYATASDGRLTVEWVDMSGGAEGAGPKDAEKRGINKYTWQSTTAKKFEISEGYMGLVVLYEDKSEKIDVLAHVADRFEYELTSRIWKLARDKPPVVGLVKPPSAPANFMNPRGGEGRFELLGTILEQVYAPSAKTWLTLDAPVADDVTVLVVAAPRALDEKSVFHLEQFLLRGGKAIVLADPVEFDQNFRVKPAQATGLEDWLKGYGVELLPGVVGDYEAQALGVWWPPARPNRYAIESFPFWPMVTASGLDANNPAVAGFRQVPFYFASEIQVDAAAQEKAGRKATVLAKTTTHGWRQADTARIYDQWMPDEKEMSSKTLAVVLQGKFDSKWKGQPSPDEPPKPVEPEKKPDGAKPSDAEKPSDSAKPSDATKPSDSTKPSDATKPTDGATPPSDKPVDKPADAPKPPSEAPPAEQPPMGDAPPPGMTDDGAKGPGGPEGEDAPPGAPPADPTKKEEPKKPKLEQGEGLLVLIGESELAADDLSGYRGYDRMSFLSQSNSNAGIFLVANLVDWLTGSEDLISLRAQGHNARRLKDVEDGTVETIKWANYLAVPLLVLLTGLLVFVVRRQGR